MRKFLTPNTLPDDFICRRVRIPNDIEWLELVNGQLAELTNPFKFELFGDITPEQCSEVFTEMFLEYQRGEPCLIGSVIPYATQDIPDGCLQCDGNTYDRVDYPRLYALLDSVYVVDADTFKVPDLRGMVIIGAGAGGAFTERSNGDTGGEETHMLTTDEMPSHSHTNSPHFHTYNYPTINLDLEAVGVPDIFGAGNPPIPLFTSAESITIDNTGSDEPHNNMQPFHAIRYCIVAR